GKSLFHIAPLLFLAFFRHRIHTICNKSTPGKIYLSFFILFGFFYGHIGGVLNDPVKVFLTYRLCIGIWSRVAKIYSVRNAISHCELYRIKIITTCLVKFYHIVLSFL